MAAPIKMGEDSHTISHYGPVSELFWFASFYEEVVFDVPTYCQFTFRPHAQS